TGGAHDAETVSVDVVEPGVRPCFARRDQGELCRPVQPPCLYSGEDVGRFDCDPAGDAHRKLLRPVLGQRDDAGPAGEERLPGRRDVASDGRRRAESGDNDSLLGVGHTPQALDRSMYATASPTVARFFTSSSGILTSNFSSA